MMYEFAVTRGTMFMVIGILFKLETMSASYNKAAIDPHETEVAAYKRLLHDVFVNYSKTSRPVKEEKHVLQVRMSMGLNQILELNSKHQILIINSYFTLRWKDDFLTWDPEHYGGIQQLYLRTDTIWRPDISLQNTADDKRWPNAVLTPNLNTITYRGNVEWRSPALLKSNCRLNVKNYPFDYQQCPLMFGSWSHQGKLVELVSEENSIPDTNHYSNNTNGEWELIGIPIRAYHKKYDCCPDTFSYMVFYLTIQRKSKFYVYHIAMPVVLQMFMGMFVFLVPSISSAKVTLSISVMLSLIVFMQMMMNTLPPTSTYISLFARFIGFVMFMLSLSMYFAILVIHIHFDGSSGAVPPLWFQKLIFNYVNKPNLYLNNFTSMVMYKLMKINIGINFSLFNIVKAKDNLNIAKNVESEKQIQRTLSSIGQYSSSKLLENQSLVGTKPSFVDMSEHMSHRYSHQFANTLTSHNSDSMRRASYSPYLLTKKVTTESCEVKSNMLEKQKTHANTFPTNVPSSRIYNRMGKKNDENKHSLSQIDEVNDNVSNNNENINNNNDKEVISERDLKMREVVNSFIDMLEEVRLVRLMKFDKRMDEDDLEFVRMTWHRLANIIDRTAFVVYLVVSVSTSVYLYIAREEVPNIDDIPLLEEL